MDKKEELKEKLKDIIKENGVSIALKPSELKAIFSKHFPIKEALSDILVQMSIARLTWSIIRINSNVVPKDKYKELLEQVKKICKVASEIDAKWALNSWIEALGKQIEGQTYSIQGKQSVQRNVPTTVPGSTELYASKIYDQLNSILRDLLSTKERELNFLENKRIKLEKGEEEYKNGLEKGEEEYKNELSEIQKYESSLRNYYDNVISHLRSIGVETNKFKKKIAPIYKSPHNVDPKSLSISDFKKASEYYSKVMSTANKSIFEYNGTGGCLGFLFLLFIIAAFSWSLVRWHSIWITIVSSIILLIFFSFKNFFNGAEDFSNFENYSDLCKFYLNGWRKKVESENNKYIENLEKKYNSSVENWENNYKERYEELQKEISSKKESILNLIKNATTQLPLLIAPWSNLSSQSVKSASSIPPFFRIGEFDKNFFGVNIHIPASLKFNEKANLIFEASDIYKKQAINNVKSIIFRLLASFPPGKVYFTFIDPVGMGNNVSEFMSLADYDESLINVKAWSEPEDINKKLEEITAHMENVIQKYLRNQYKTIKEFNDNAGELAEPYRVLVIFDFPANFNDETLRRLVSIVNNGPRCGVYVIIVQDIEKQLPYGFNTSDLKKNSTTIGFKDTLVIDEVVFRPFNYNPDTLPQDYISKSIVENVGQVVKSSSKIEVSYDKMLDIANITQNYWWKKSSKDKIEVPLGITGARKIQSLTLGEGTNHHALVIGQTGSGKSNLMHIIITTCALTYSPDEIELYLIDFKEGVEFKPYATLPLVHCKVIAIESEREFGISVLRGLEAESNRRGELFRKAGVKDLQNYREKAFAKMSRIILIIDEFQKFFSEDDEIAGEAAMILDNLARQGRGFGIHIFLSTQSLSGTSSNILRSTLAQIETRIALKCGDTDSRLALSDDNSQAVLLSRPGEAIYNDKGGLKEGNNFFQIAFLKSEVRNKYFDYLSALIKKNMKERKLPIIFEGNAPANFEECNYFKELINKKSWSINLKNVEAYLGEPIAIKPTILSTFKHQSGSNLLIITREEKEGVAMTVTSILSIAAQYSPKDAEFYIIDLTSVDEAWADLPEELQARLPHKIEVLGKKDLKISLTNIINSLNNRLNSESIKYSETFLILLGAHRARDLRIGEIDYSYSSESNKEKPLNEIFKAILKEGPEAGIHTLAWFDTYSNVQKVLSRRDLQEFSMRVVGIMSSEDSLSLIDESAASKINKPNRLIYFDDNRPGVLEKFRPFDLPTTNYIMKIGSILKTFK